MLSWNKHSVARAAGILRCSFCNKTQHEIQKLIAGPTVFICDECVAACVDIMVSDTRDKAPDSLEAETARDLARALPHSAAQCGFCGQPVTVQDVLPIEGRGVLCAACADAIDDALARGRPEP
jgi:hypothetical protein